MKTPKEANTEPARETTEMLKRLQEALAPYDTALVAYSGGVDSSLALAAAVRFLGAKNVVAVTSNNETYLPSELQLAEDFAGSLSVEHIIVNTRELDNPDYAKNPTNRCYFCKSTLYSDLAKMADELGYACVIDGANADDEGDHRPGRKAAKEENVVSPLALARLTKDEVRALAKHLGLPSWDKPALACLSSRFPYGEEITPEKLRRVTRAEEFLRSLGFRQVRVRHHENIARLEVSESELERAFAMREEISAELKDAGFLYVALEMTPYRSGSLNAVLQPKSGSKKRKPLLPVV